MKARTVLLVALASSACTIPPPAAQLSGPALPEHARCFALTYSPADAASAFPQLLAMGRGLERGPAAWLPSAYDTTGVWRMFQQPAQWSRSQGDTVRISFSNGFSTVALHLVASDTIVMGRAQWHSDVVGSDPAPAQLHGRAVECQRP